MTTPTNQSNSSAGSADSPPILYFDATVRRREKMRLAAEQHGDVPGSQNRAQPAAPKQTIPSGEPITPAIAPSPSTQPSSSTQVPLTSPANEWPVPVPPSQVQPTVFSTAPAVIANDNVNDMPPQQHTTTEQTAELSSVSAESGSAKASVPDATLSTSLSSNTSLAVSSAAAYLSANHSAADNKPADREELTTFAVNFVVEHTGYPLDMVELDADLEADLGIDSITLAQLLGELRDKFSVTPTGDLSLEDFATLNNVVEIFHRASHGHVFPPKDSA